MPVVQPDDAVYRVNATYLGPPGFQFPFRARYVAWLIGFPVGVVVLWAYKSWFGLGVFTVAWALVTTVVITRWMGGKITHQRGLLSVLQMFSRELTTPRRRTTYVGGAASLDRVRINPHRPRPTAPSESPSTPARPGQQQSGAVVTRETPRV